MKASKKTVTETHISAFSFAHFNFHLHYPVFNERAIEHVIANHALSLVGSC